MDGLTGEALRGLLEALFGILAFMFLAQLWQGWTLRGISQLLKGYNGEDGLIAEVKGLKKSRHDHANEILGLKFHTGMIKTEGKGR